MSNSPLQNATNIEELEQTEAAVEQQAPPGGWRNPRLGFVLLAGFASVGTNAALLSAAIATLSIKATQLGGQAQAANILSAVVGLAGLATLVGYPVLGRLSDRTTWSLGRRRPYLLIGAVLMALGGLLTVLVSSVPLLILANVVTSIGGASALVAVTAIIPDLWAPERRGPVAALIALGTPVGALVGLALTTPVTGNVGLMVLYPYALAVIATVLLAVVLKDRRLAKTDRPRFDLREFATTFWVNPVTNRNYGLVWWSRLLLFFGVAAVNAYQFLYLLVGLRVGSPQQVGVDIFLATLVLVGVSLVFAPIAAKVSDVIGRRKPFVIVSAALFAVGIVLVTVAKDFPSFLLAIAVVGLGQGIYFAVDLALATQVLPDQQAAGKDLGILNLASTLPSALVPAVAPALLAIGASAAGQQNFGALFIAGAITSLVGAVLIVFVRGVK